MTQPGYIFDGDRELAKTLIPHAYKWLHYVREFVRTSGAQVYGITRPIPGGYCQCLSSAGTERIYIFAEPLSKKASNELELEMMEVLSGVTRGATLVDDKLRDYRPTAQAWEYPLKKDPLKSPNAFTDEERLAVPPSFELALGGATQYQRLKATMYSGRMTKLVQFLLGFGKFKHSQGLPGYKDGAKVEYDFRWARTHGIHRATDGKFWLIEISMLRGVLAMPLPLFKGSTIEGPLREALKGSKQDVLKTAMQEYDGIPSGALFPSGFDLTQAIAAGNVLRLLQPSALAGFYAGEAFSSALGWAFNTNGTQAHNTMQFEGSSYMEAAHFRINISIGPTLTDRPPNTPLAVAEASITEVLRQPMVWPLAMTARFHVYEPLTDGFVCPNFTQVADEPGYSTDATLFVCFHGDALKRLKYSWTPGTIPEGDYGPKLYRPFTDPLSELTQHVQGASTERVNLPHFYNPDDDRRVGLENVTIMNWILGAPSHSPPVRFRPQTGLYADLLTRCYYSFSVYDMKGVLNQEFYTSAVVPQACRSAFGYFEYVTAEDMYDQRTYDEMRKPDRWKFYVSYHSPIYAENGIDIIGSKYAMNRDDLAEVFGEHNVLDYGKWENFPKYVPFYFSSPDPNPWYDPDIGVGSQERYDQYLAAQAAAQAQQSVTHQYDYKKAVVRLYTEFGDFEHVSPNPDATLADWQNSYLSSEFSYTYSVLGAAHQVRSPNFGVAKERSGPLLSTEPNPTTANYTFLGYT